MARTYSGYGDKVTPQNEPILGTVANSAGGFSFAIDDWKRLERFLILGSEGGSYYANEHKLTKSNVEAISQALAEDGVRFVKTVVEISTSGRAAKNEPALFALALALSKGDTITKRWAKSALRDVARTGTHLFSFVEYAEEFRGWGRVLRDAVANWYTSRSPSSLAYQLIKYQSRGKWSHRDLLRLAHPKAEGPLNDVLHWGAKGWTDIGPDAPTDESGLRQIWAFEMSKRMAPSEAGQAALIRKFRLPREAVPTESLNNTNTWSALLDEPMGMTAMIRNLATMTRIGLLADFSRETQLVTSRLRDAELLRAGRVHPVQVLAGMLTYASGVGVRSRNTWTPVRGIVDALDAAFYASFGTVQPTNKRLILALDVSGSMAGGAVANVPGLTPRVAAAAMSLITAAVEPNYTTVAFTASGNWNVRSLHDQAAGVDGITTLPISPRQRLDNVVKLTDNLNFGATDCALPMLWALKNKVEADAFVIYTDSETWAGQIHPTQALQMYRNKMGIAAKLIVVGMVSNGFSIADPNDAGMLDVVGFDLNTPNLISNFIVE